MEFWFYIIMTFVAFIIIELFFRSIVLSVNKKFQWLIIDRNEFPKLSEKQGFYDPLSTGDTF